jgi:hypothetical protein
MGVKGKTGDFDGHSPVVKTIGHSEHEGLE